MFPISHENQLTTSIQEFCGIFAEKMLLIFILDFCKYLFEINKPTCNGNNDNLQIEYFHAYKIKI